MLTQINESGDFVSASGYEKPIIDKFGNFHLLGATQDSINTQKDYLSGFIYSWCYSSWVFWPIPVNGDGQCNLGKPANTYSVFSPTEYQCTKDAGFNASVAECDYVCLVNCPWNEYFDEETETCQPCDNGCERCIMAGDNCPPCFEEGCYFCQDFRICDDCPPFATLIDGSCVCDDNYYQTEDKSQCLPCSPCCEKCTDGTNYSCTECKANCFMQSGHSICLSNCPTGYTENSTTRACDGDPQEHACFTFDINITEGWTSSTGVSLTSHDVTPVYERGMYFDGADYMRFGGSLMLHQTFTIQMWIRYNAPGVLFSSNKQSYETAGAEDCMTYGIQDSGSDVVMFMRYYQDGVAVLDVVDTQGIQAEYWSLLDFTIVWSDQAKRTALTFRINTDDTTVTLISEFPIVDMKSYIHLLGAEQNSNNGQAEYASYYTGFIYELCLTPIIDPTLIPNP